MPAGNPFAYEPMRLGAAFLQGEAIARDREQQRQAMALRQVAEDRARQENEYAQQVRPLEMTGRQLALRGQILGTVETPEDYARVLPTIKELGLPTGDLPAGSQSTAWLQFRKPQEPAQSWLPERFRPADLSPVPQAERMSPALSQATMQAQGIAPEDVASVQRAAERGLPIVQQSKIRDADVGRQIQLANLARVQDKDALSREWMAFQREAKVQGMSEAETQRQFQRNMANLGYQMDVQKFELQRKAAEREAAKPNINEGQARAVLFGQEVAASLTDFEDLLKKGFDPTSAKGAGDVTLASSGPLGAFASNSAKIWNNASDQLAQAALRFESGAAIGEQEFGKKIRANIPRFGDSPDVVRRKLEAIRRAKTAFESYTGKSFTAGPTQTATTLPPAAVAALKEGKQTRFGNGQVWTLRNGKPVQVK